MGSCQSSGGGAAVAQPSSASPAASVAAQHSADKAAAPGPAAKPADGSHHHGVGVKASGEVHDKYQMGKALGSGSFATARLATNRETGEKVAIKTLLRNHEMFDKELLDLEIKVMKRVSQDSAKPGTNRCIQLYEVYEDKKAIHLVEELASGGELFDRILDLGHFSEKLAAKVINQVLEGIAHMHSVGCVHRDLKPENLLMLSSEVGTAEYDMIKIADFGLSALGDTHDENGQMNTVCGTPDYIAPEVVIIAAEGPHSRRKYDAKVDVWAIGVILYTMLCGFPPFWSDNMADMLHMIKHGDYSFPAPAWDHISPETKAFVTRLLTVDPKRRPTATEAMLDPWIAQVDNLGDTALKIKDTLGSYVAARRGRQVFNTVRIAKRFEIMMRPSGNSVAKELAGDAKPAAEGAPADADATEAAEAAPE
ncbi:kinase-like domain-containing protein [Baffinella frigidus]|nr:kinase-like domain-containing protein [Cryptophyta sp. CCMP2293]|mmetsp:Transcript_43849/g.104216  ORF Transcript_43849/g.104216 Transcript_43849/m.104216 type:complete len:423 (+) Transcript_43849:154-1422(+)